MKRPPASPTYQDTCSVCGALPGNYCKTRNGKLSRYAHSVRGRESLSESGLPDLSSWWRAMARYEGKFALPRPEGLVIP